SPGAIGAVAKPITWPYLRTGSPAARARVAILCPAGTFAASTTGPASVSTVVPAASRSLAITTSSSGCSRSVLHIPLYLPRLLDRGDILARVLGHTRVVAPAQSRDVHQIGAGAHRRSARGDEVAHGRRGDAAGRD